MEFQTTQTMGRPRQLCNLGTRVGCIVIFVMTFSCILQLTSAEKRLGEQCTEHNECATKLCHPTRKTCDCYELRDYSVGKKLDQIYDLGMCFSRINQMCTLAGADLDGLPPWNCIPDAICDVMHNGKGTKKMFGRCSCKPGYSSSDNGKRCISNAELRTAQAPISMDQKIPDEWNRSGSSSDILKNSSTAYVIASLVILCCMFPFR